MADPNLPRVYLVGAGPGDPGLLTLRAVECLAAAELVIYDRLVPSRLLDFAPSTAEKVCVSDVEERHARYGPAVVNLVISAARAGKSVVRLKGGDPFIFGRGGEEAAALREAGLAYEIVPGVTAVCAAAASAEIPLTHRDVASAVALVTGHEYAAKSHPELDWAALARFPGTLAVYMGLSRLDAIARRLIGHGKPAETPAAIVAAASTGDQRRVHSTLAGIAEATREAGTGPPAVLIVGAAAGHAPAISWFENRPLFGRRIVVTRPRDQARDFVRRLEQLGAMPLVMPAAEIRMVSDWSSVDASLARLSEYDWLVFTSVNGVQAFMTMLLQTGRDLRSLAAIRLAAIGPGTAEALRTYHLVADVVPTEYRAEALAAAVAARAAGQRILLARADRGRAVLREELEKVAIVDELVVYRQCDMGMPGDPVYESLRRGLVDYVTLTSANIARSFLTHVDAAGRERIHAGEVRLATISPVTSAAVSALGFPIAVEARVYTIEGILDALVIDAGAWPLRAVGLEQVAESIPRQVSENKTGNDPDDINHQESGTSAKRDSNGNVEDE